MHKADFLMQVGKMIQVGNDFVSRKAPRGVNTAKVENIIKVLCPHMEPVKRKFWLELPKNEDLPDLQIERDPSEAKNDEDPSDED